MRKNLLCKICQRELLAYDCVQVCVFDVVVIAMFFNSVFLFSCLFVYVCCCCFFFFVCYFFIFRDISLNTYVIEAVMFSGLSMILVKLWKTLRQSAISLGETLQSKGELVL